jgi:hypothetical protein
MAWWLLDDAPGGTVVLAVLLPALVALDDLLGLISPKALGSPSMSSRCSGDECAGELDFLL